MAINTTTPPEVAANNAQADAIRAETDQLMRETDAQNRAQMEKLFLVNLDFSERAHQAEAFADNFGDFVETRSHNKLNELAANEHLDLPYPDAMADWESSAGDTLAERDRRERGSEDFVRVVEGEMPDQMNDAQDAMNRNRLDVGGGNDETRRIEDDLNQEEQNLTDMEGDLGV